MSAPAEVTPHDIELARIRREIADKGQADLQKAIAACGPGHTAYAFWYIVDNAGFVTEEISIPCCRPKSGGGWQPKPPTRFTYERSPLKYFTRTDGGFMNCAMRWTVGIQVLDNYNPKSAEQLAEGRARRQQRKLEKTANDMPLFETEILNGTFTPTNPQKKSHEQIAISSARE